MTVAIQLHLFESNDEINLLRQEIAIVKEQIANTRRGLFARHGEIAKQLLELKGEVDVLKGKQPVEPLVLHLFK